MEGKEEVGGGKEKGEGEIVGRVELMVCMELESLC